MTTALLIIDVQHALCSGQYEAFEAPRVIDRINHATRLARAAGVPVIYIQHEEPDGPLQYGTAGWQLDARLDALATDTRVRKTAPDSFHKTALQEILTGLGVTTLIVCGLQSEYCVDTTTRRALALGYPVTLLADAHSTLDNSVLSAAQIAAHHNETLSQMSSFGPRVTVLPASQLALPL